MFGMRNEWLRYKKTDDILYSEECWWEKDIGKLMVNGQAFLPQIIELSFICNHSPTFSLAEI